MIILLGRGMFAYGIQQLASQPIQLSLFKPLFGRLEDVRSLGETIQALYAAPQA